MDTRIEPFPRERRHTLYFLDQARAFAPVFLDTEVDWSGIRRRRTSGRGFSTVTHVLHAAARVLAEHPEANSAFSGGVRPKVARYGSVNGKLTFDKVLNGRRIVLSTVLEGLQAASLEEIQDRVEHFRDGDPAVMPEFARVRALHRLPWLAGPVAYRAVSRSLRRRPQTMGTFAVTSLGHRPVDGFHSVGGTTITLGLGRVTDRPVVRGGRVEVAPVLRLNLAFDHRAIDGAEAADVLAEIKERLEADGGGAIREAAAEGRANGTRPAAPRGTEEHR
ncbi:2-oxo acid dehydrogenase subunit E2 [Actinomadura syzygii]|uniref:2-oxo acid dehydrogenase subunit E2 n=1 Tax=Actinomadura syzygii TaxID=1427538 RepID=A0A5D0TY71_9ACTN|nr:2-oxo acid dehydrogenase subunit E2 [Actinomadura syzygii]TYC10316.1 2-oxo acid dehydrogenase subunit E2 [Actinomadura syzygii]